MAKVVILIGKTGSGKSTLANVISGTNEFVESGSSVSVTKEIKKSVFSDSGISYAVIDTVGIGDTQLKREEVLDKIAEAVYLAKDGISQILFVTNGRFDQFETSIYSLLSTIIFDKSVTDYTTIVRTKFPEFEREKERQKDIEEMLASKGDLSNIIKTCQQRVVHIDNPSLDVDAADDENDDERKEREEVINLREKTRNKSQERVLEHLQKICLKQEKEYKPEKLQKLSNEISNYMKKKIESKMKFAKKEETERKKPDSATGDQAEEIRPTIEKDKQKIDDDDNLFIRLLGELSELKETKKLIEEIQVAEVVIRQKVLNHIFNSYNEITQVVGGNVFINNIMGNNNDFSDVSKLSFAEILEQKEKLEAKLGSGNQSLEQVKVKINQKEQELNSKKGRAEIKKIFDIFDYNGNGVLNLSEINKAVIEYYPHLAENQPAIMRAYKAADTSQDGFIDFKEFGRLIDLLHCYNEIFKIFKKLDTDNDRRVSFAEFKKGHELIGINVGSNKELMEKFSEIDINHTGYILFDEFCIHAAKTKLIAANI